MELWRLETWTGRFVFGILDKVSHLHPITSYKFNTISVATSLISLTLPTTSPVPSVTCHPTSSFTLASAIYSGVVQIWDIRSPKTALFTVSKAQSKLADPNRKVTKNGKVLGERLLAVDWDGDVLVAGGEDGEVGIWRARGE